MLNWLWQYVKPYRLQLVLAIIALTATAGLTLSLGQGVRMLVDQGFAAGSVQGLSEALTVFMVIVVLISIGAYSRFFLVSWLGERVVADIRKQLYSHLIKLQPSFYEDNLSGEIQSRITTDTTLLQTVIGSSFSFALRNALTFFGGLVLMFISNVKLTLIVMLAVPMIVFPLIFLGRKVKALSKKSQDKIADVGAWASESLQHIKVVQAFNQEPRVENRFSNAAEGAFDVAILRIRQRAMLIGLVMLLVMGAIAGMLYVGGSDVINGELSGGDLAGFIFYAIMVAGSLAAITEVYGEVQRAAGAVERIQELMAEEAKIVSPDAPNAIQNEQAKTALELKEASFFYPSRPEVAAINQVSLDIKQGESIAIVGPSGAGKSTLFDLLLRFRDLDSGNLFVQEQDVQTLALEDLRKEFALVPQQPVLFSDSVLENLRYGSPDATDEEVFAAAKAAHAEEFIGNLPNGYDSFLGEQGVKLSGGQRQRLAIARAILRDPKILLLDEATSALDAESEKLVQDALNELMQHRTTIVIAHRLATVMHVDRIVVMDKGEIVAVGTHQELMRMSPLYQKLARLQFDVSLEVEEA